MLVSLLPLPRAVFFPGQVGPAELPDALRSASVIAVFGQRDPTIDPPRTADLEPVGCLAEVLDGAVLRGTARVRLDEVVGNECRVTPLDELRADDERAHALETHLRAVAFAVVELTPELPPEAKALVESVEGAGALADLLAANLEAELDEQSALLQTTDVPARASRVLVLLARQLEIMDMRRRVERRVRAELTGTASPSEMLRLQQRILESEREASAADETYRSTATRHEIDLRPPAGSWLRALGIGRSRAWHAHIGQQLAAIRELQRREVVAAQLEAIAHRS